MVGLYAIGVNYPNVVTILICSSVFFIFNKFDKSELKFYIISLFIFFLSIVLSPGIDEINSKIIGFIQISISLLVFIYIIRFFDINDIEYLRKIINYILIIFLAFSLFEILGILKPYSDAFRHTIYPNEILYEGDIRDLNIIGHIRPKVFSSEPSHASKLFFSLILSAAFISKKNNVKYYIIISILSIYIFGSMILLVAAIIMVYTRILPEFSNLKKFYFIIISSLVIYLFVLYFDYFFPGLHSRIVRFGQGEDMSGMYRLIFPYITAYDVFSNNLLFGIGISTKEVIFNYTSLPLDIIPPDKVIGDNALARIFIYLGIIGGSLFLINLLKFLKNKYKLDFLITILIFLVVSNIMGGFEVIRYWMILGLIYSSYICSKRYNLI